MLKHIKDSQLNYIIQNFLNLFSSKVDKEEGKQLSTNDFNEEDKNKLVNIKNNATRNKITFKYWTTDDLPDDVEFIDVVEGAATLSNDVSLIVNDGTGTLSNNVIVTDDGNNNGYIMLGA